MSASSASTQLILFLPGLLWPDDSLVASLDSIALPNLQALLRFAKSRKTEAQTIQDYAVKLFGLHTESTIAQLRYAGEASAQELSASLLCADPCTLYFARQHLLLGDANMLQLTLEEAVQVVTDLNREFTDVGEFIAPHPNRWYLKTNLPLAQFFKLDQAVGRPVSLFQPQGEHARQWSRIQNELQIFCHNHPINRSREASGHPILNGLWLWGNDRLQPSPKSLAPKEALIYSDEPITRGLVCTNEYQLKARHDFKLDNSANTSSCVVDMCLYENSLQRDGQSWLQNLQRLEQKLFAPILAGFNQGKFEQIRICAPSETHTLEVDLFKPKWWQIWRTLSVSPSKVSSTLCSSENLSSLNQ